MDGSFEIQNSKVSPPSIFAILLPPLRPSRRCGCVALLAISLDDRTRAAEINIVNVASREYREERQLAKKLDIKRDKEADMAVLVEMTNEDSCYKATDIALFAFPRSNSLKIQEVASTRGEKLEAQKANGRFVGQKAALDRFVAPMKERCLYETMTRVNSRKKSNSKVVESDFSPSRNFFFEFFSSFLRSSLRERLTVQADRE